MRNKKRLSAMLTAAVVLTASAVSMSGSAVTTVRDPDGDGRILVSDGSFILQYLVGGFNPTSQKSLDFDGNGIISKKDATVLSHYWMQLINGSSLDGINLPAPVGADTQAVATTREYVRHYYSSSDPTSYSEYSLTVDPYNNTNTSPNANSQQRVVIGDNDMQLDPDTAVIQLQFSGGTGSAFIVDDHLIATAAHCVCKDQNFFNMKIKLKDSNNNVKWITPKYIDANKNFYDNYNSNGNPNTSDYNTYLLGNDYALIYVEEDLSNYGIFNMGVALNEYADNHGEVIVSGFPSKSAYPSWFEATIEKTRFKAKGKILSRTPKYINYDADTAPGDSGGPVYVQEEFSGDTYNTVIAINVAETYNSKDPNNDSVKKNHGVRITPDILNFFYNNPNIE